MGIEPTLRPYQGRKLPLHHRGSTSAEFGVRNPESTPYCLHSALRVPHSRTEERPVGVEPTHPPWQGDRQPLHHGRVHNRQSIRRDLHPRHHRGRVACLLLHHGRTPNPTVEAVGIEPTLSCLRDRCLGQRRPHFRCSGPEGIRTPDLLRDRETATPLARGTTSHSALYGTRTRLTWLTLRPTHPLRHKASNANSRQGRNRTPRAPGHRIWKPAAFPDAIPTYETSTPCWVRTRPLRLERPPTSPEVQQGVTDPGTNANRPGALLRAPPAGSRGHATGAEGHPLVSLAHQ